MQGLQRRGHDRHHRGAHAQAHDEQRPAEQPVRGVRVDLGEGEEPGGDEHQREGHRPADGHPVGQDPGDRHRDHRTDALRRDQQAGGQRRLTAHLQEVARERAARHP